MEFLNIHDSLSANQHGSICRESTTINLLCRVNYWTDILVDKNNVDIIYLDPAKVFNFVVGIQQIAVQIN